MGRPGTVRDHRTSVRAPARPRGSAHAVPPTAPERRRSPRTARDHRLDVRGGWYDRFRQRV